MAQVSGTGTEADRAPARHRRHAAPRRRGLEVAGLALGLAAGVGVAIGWLVPSLGHLSGRPPVNSPPVTVRSSSGSPGAPMTPDPAALDAEWAAYSDRSGRLLYRDPSIGLDDAHDFRIMYEARAEPALSAGHELVISYNVNSEGVNTGCQPMALYTNAVTLPRFVTVPLAAFGPGSGPGSGRGAQVRSARSGPPDDPGIARRNPAQWFDSWGLRHGCPHLPAVTSVHASASSGQVRLGWPEAGLGVRYLIYLHAPGQPGGDPVARTYRDGVTLTGLRPGRYVARVVPANVRKYRGRGAEVTFTVR